MTKRRILFDLSTSFQWRGRPAVGVIRTERELARRLLCNPDIECLPVILVDGVFRALSIETALSIVSPKPVEPLGGPKNQAVALDVPVDQGLEVVRQPAFDGAAIPQQDRKPEFQPDSVPLDADCSHSLRPPSAVRAKTVQTRLWFTGRLRAAVRWCLSQAPEAFREDIRAILIAIRSLTRKFVYGTRPPEAKAIAAAHKEMASVIESPVRPPVRPVRPVASKDLEVGYEWLVHPGPNDVLFLCGLGWDVMSAPALSKLVKERGVKIISIMYDLIPIYLKEYTHTDSDGYLNYFLHMIDLCDEILCISECTERDLKKFCLDNKRNVVKSSIVYLGSEISTSISLSEVEDNKIRERLGRRRFALSVGTLEIRKNYKLLFDIWDELLEDESFDLDLVIVGMPGWKTDDLVRRMEASRHFGTRIIWFSRLSDEGLAWLYENTHLFLFPSHYEGWGLPVVEALGHGRPAIISNRGATPEAGMGIATVIDISDYQAWRDAVRNYSKKPWATHGREVHLPTWEEAAKTVARAALSL